MDFQRVNWLQLKTFIVSNGLEQQVKYIIKNNDYVIRVKDAFFKLETYLDAKHLLIPTAPQVGSDTEDWEVNFLPLSDVKRGNDSYTPDERLRTDTAVSDIVTDRVVSWDNKFIYNDMNVANGGIARSTPVLDSVFSTIYSYNGSGILQGFIVTLEKLDDGWDIDLVVDGVSIFDIGGISTRDMDKTSVYGFDVNKETQDNWLGFDIQKNTLRWEGAGNKPMVFNTNITLNVKRVTGQGTKKFKAGLVGIYKEF